MFYGACEAYEKVRCRCGDMHGSDRVKAFICISCKAALDGSIMAHAAHAAHTMASLRQSARCHRRSKAKPI